MRVKIGPGSCVNPDELGIDNLDYNTIDNTIELEL